MSNIKMQFSVKKQETEGEAVTSPSLLITGLYCDFLLRAPLLLGGKGAQAVG